MKVQDLLRVDPPKQKVYQPYDPHRMEIFYVPHPGDIIRLGQPGVLYGVRGSREFTTTEITTIWHRGINDTLIGFETAGATYKAILRP